jgi:hypothetical protein
VHIWQTITPAKRYQGDAGTNRDGRAGVGVEYQLQFQSHPNVINITVGGTTGTTATSWDGDIGDVVMSGQALTMAQRQEIQTYLSEKYETTATKKRCWAKPPTPTAMC